MDEKAQVSIEYLLTVLFSIVLALIAATLALQIRDIAAAAQGKIFDFRLKAISAFLGN